VEISEYIKTMPKTYGCYIFKNKHGDIIYIGKSKNLRNRVRQYFYNTSSDKRNKIIDLVREITDIEYITTENESDSLILECFLIKKHYPKYNSMLKGNASFPFIKINLSQDYPTIRIVEHKDELCDFFGYFYSQWDAQDAIEILSRVYKTPTCNKKKFTKNARACLRYHLDKCTAPCEMLINKGQYVKTIKEVISFLRNENIEIISRLSTEYDKCIENLEFEKAKVLHENMTAMRYLSRKMKKLNSDLDGNKFLLFFRALNEPTFSVFYIENRVVLDRKIFDNISEEEIFEYSKKIMNRDFFINDEYIKINYLLEIYADKYFVKLEDSQLNPFAKDSQAEISHPNKELHIFIKQKIDEFLE